MQRNTKDLMTALAPMFARVEPRLQAAKYVRAVMSDLPKRNGWTIAEHPESSGITLEQIRESKL